MCPLCVVRVRLSGWEGGHPGRENGIDRQEEEVSTRKGTRIGSSSASLAPHSDGRTRFDEKTGSKEPQKKRWLTIMRSLSALSHSPCLSVARGCCADRETAEENRKRYEKKGKWCMTSRQPRGGNAQKWRVRVLAMRIPVRYETRGTTKKREGGGLGTAAIRAFRKALAHP